MKPNVTYPFNPDAEKALMALPAARAVFPATPRDILSRLPWCGSHGVWEEDFGADFPPSRRRQPQVTWLMIFRGPGFGGRGQRERERERERERWGDTIFSHFSAKAKIDWVSPTRTKEAQEERSQVFESLYRRTTLLVASSGV